MRFGSDINKNNLKKALIVGIGASLVGVAGARLIARTIVNRISDRFYNIISKDLYDENLWDNLFH